MVSPGAVFNGWQSEGDGNQSIDYPTRPMGLMASMPLAAPDGKRYAMPTLAKQQGDKARKMYWEGGEMGDK